MAVNKRTRYEVLTRDNRTCRYCRATDAPLTIDHVVPTALGGSDKPDNLVTACRDCNAGKSSSSPDAAVVAAPADPAARFTHALALLREERAADALGVFHDFDVFVERMAPGEQAIVVAIWEANGMSGHAANLRRTLDPALLEQGEYALILRAGEPGAMGGDD